MTRPSARSALGTLALLAVACGTPDDPGPGATEPAPTIAVMHDFGATSVDDVGAGGRIVVDGGCVYIDGQAGERLTVVWPPGSRWDAGDGGVETPTALVRPGDHVSANGTYVDTVEALSLMAIEGDDVVRRCLEVDQVAVFKADVRVVEPDPATTPPTSPAPSSDGSAQP